MKRLEQSVDTRPERWLRSIWMLTLILWFIWIGLEDQSAATVLGMSAIPILAVAVTVYIRRVRRLLEAGTSRIGAILLIGLAAGTLVSPTAVLLMAVKTALHNHVVPDFTPQDIISVLASTPVWALGSVLLAAAGALLDHVLSQASFS